MFFSMIWPRFRPCHKHSRTVSNSDFLMTTFLETAGPCSRTFLNRLILYCNLRPLVLFQRCYVHWLYFQNLRDPVQGTFQNSDFILQPGGNLRPLVLFQKESSMHALPDVQNKLASMSLKIRRYTYLPIQTQCAKFV